MVRQNSTNIYSNSRYVVDGNAASGCYLTIQSAINTAQAAGGNATVWVRVGTYTENLTLYDTVDLEGADSALSIIVGTHTPPNAGFMSFTRIGLNSGTDILNSAAAGTTAITLSRCVFNLTNGYVFNLTNWTGNLKLRYCIDNSTINGVVYNTGGSAVTINHSLVGKGTANVFTANGNVFSYGTDLSCPIALSGTGVSQIQGGSLVRGNVSTADTHTLTMGIAGVSAGAASAITHNSANTLVLNNVVLKTTNATAIAGTGTIQQTNVSYPDNYDAAGTIVDDLVGTVKTEQILANNIINMDDTGFFSWAAAAPYFDDTTLGTFQLLVGGKGYIRNERVIWVAQNITGMTAGNTYWIYIDSTGTIGKTATRTDALFVDNIVLFECMRDSTAVTNNQVTVKENHNYNFQTDVSNYLHDVVGSVIENNQGGANITLVGTQKIAIAGADVYEDHGLETDIPDSAGAGVTWIRMFTLVSGKWARQNATDTFTGFYNNGGTATALTAGRFAIYTLYVCKDSLNVTTPTYFAVLHTAQFNTIGAARVVIAAGTNAKATQELASLELCQLGTIIYSEAVTAIVEVRISKTTLRSTISTGGTSIASAVTTDVAAFNGWLTAADTNVQAALNTLDDVGLNVSPQYAVLTAGAAYAIHPLAVGATGTLLVGATAGYPAFGTSAVGDFTFTSATAGQDRTLTVSNTDNSAAASSAHVQVTVGGTTSTGDPYINFLVTGAGTWNVGIDNSVANDPFKIASSAFGTYATDLMIFTNSIITTPTAFAVGRSDRGNSRGYLNSSHNNAAKWTSGTWMIPNIEAFDEGAGTASTLISLCSQTDNNGICRFAWINVPGNNQAGTLYLAHGDAAGADAALITKLSISDQGLVTLTNGLTVNSGAVAINLGTDASAKTITIGNATGATSVVIDCGTGALSLGANAIARTTTLGNTTGASVLALKCGTGDFTLASATGTIISALDTGEVTMALQPAFHAYVAGGIADVTGDGTVYTIAFGSERFDQSADYNTGTYTFTAPVTGKYFLNSSVVLSSIVGTSGYIKITTSNETYIGNLLSPSAIKEYSVSGASLQITVLADMDAADTATVQVSCGVSTKTVDIFGGAAPEYCWFSGHLVC